MQKAPTRSFFALKGKIKELYGRPIKRMLDNAVALHLAAGKPLHTSPFYDIYGRTGDTRNAASGCRRLLGYSHPDGVYASDLCDSDDANHNVGLLAGWN